MALTTPPTGTCTSLTVPWFKLLCGNCFFNFGDTPKQGQWWILPSIPKQLPVTKSEIVGDDRLIKSAGANRCTLANLRAWEWINSQPVYEGEAESMSPTPLGESASLVPLFVFMLSLIQGMVARLLIVTELPVAGRDSSSALEP